jgi:hypothetical protein
MFEIHHDLDNKGMRETFDNNTKFYETVLTFQRFLGTPGAYLRITESKAGRIQFESEYESAGPCGMQSGIFKDRAWLDRRLLRPVPLL